MSLPALLLALSMTMVPAPAPPAKRAATHSDAIAVSAAEIPQPPPGATVMAGYLEVRSAADDQLIGVSGDLSDTIQMHQMRHVDGRMEMRQVPAIDLPAGRPVRLERGGLHLMILNPVRRPLIGDTVHLTLHFRVAGGLSVPFQVVDGRTPDPHAHH